MKQKIRRNSTNDLDGLLSCMEDWHAKVILLEVKTKYCLLELYQTDNMKNTSSVYTTIMHAWPTFKFSTLALAVDIWSPPKKTIGTFVYPLLMFHFHLILFC